MNSASAFARKLARAYARTRTGTVGAGTTISGSPVQERAGRPAEFEELTRVGQLVLASGLALTVRSKQCALCIVQCAARSPSLAARRQPLAACNQLSHTIIVF